MRERCFKTNLLGDSGDGAERGNGQGVRVIVVAFELPSYVTFIN